MRHGPVMRHDPVMKEHGTSQPIVFVIDDDASVCVALKELFQSVRMHVELFPSASAFAAGLGVSEVIVKVHRANAMRKMRAKSLPELIRMSDLLGIATPKAA
jgi:FixJ family two-component response regulator